ncbi:MAG: peptidase papain [Cyanobacteria bacterium RYN_339]|nr:peptidase papain [Cyanobacteria bacterium RYN_339]
MKPVRHLSIAMIALLATACGHNTPVTGASTVAASAANTIMAAGVERKLGFDWDQYQKDYAPKAHPVHLPRQALLPSSVDLRKNAPPVYDQGHLGSCTAFACAKGLRESLQRTENQRVTPLSGLFQYYETRASTPVIGWILVKQDCGGTISGAISVIAKQGAAPEDTWPYDISKFTQKPPKEAYAAAPEFKFKSTKQLGGLDDVKTSLAGGHMVAFGFRVYESFKKIGADGVMPVPASSEKLLGGHAILAVGYDDAKQALIVRNSWSATWGDHGYFYMPYKVAGDSGTSTDFWTAE